MGHGVHAFAAGLGAFVLSATAHAEPTQAIDTHREVVPANDTAEAPPGYHRETRPRYGMLIGGGITTGVGALMFFGGLERRWREKHTPGDLDPDSSGQMMMIMGGVTLAIGLPLLTYGILAPRDVYVRDSMSELSVRLVASPTWAGPELVGSF
jgi:hypothetical protein